MTGDSGHWPSTEVREATNEIPEGATLAGLEALTREKVDHGFGKPKRADAFWWLLQESSEQILMTRAEEEGWVRNTITNWAKSETEVEVGGDPLCFGRKGVLLVSWRRWVKMKRRT